MVLTRGIVRGFGSDVEHRRYRCAAGPSGADLLSVDIQPRHLAIVGSHDVPPDANYQRGGRLEQRRCTKTQRVASRTGEQTLALGRVLAAERGNNDGSVRPLIGANPAPQRPRRIGCQNGCGGCERSGEPHTAAEKFGVVGAEIGATGERLRGRRLRQRRAGEICGHQRECEKNLKSEPIAPHELQLPESAVSADNDK